VLSINSLREDLEVSFATIRKWLLILEKLDAIFRIAPFGAAKIKAVKKEQKLYFWDWPRAESEGARFENMIALHLLRLLHWQQDVHGEACDLRFFRHREGKEVDFIFFRKGKPWMAIETKSSETALSPSLSYLLERFEIPLAFQVVANLREDKRVAN